MMRADMVAEIGTALNTIHSIAALSTPAQRTRRLCGVARVAMVEDENSSTLFTGLLGTLRAAATGNSNSTSLVLLMLLVGHIGAKSPANQVCSSLLHPPSFCCSHTITAATTSIK